MVNENKKSFLKEKIEELFGIDVRSLALFRICIALLITFDLVLSSTSLVAHYTDNGVLPRSEIMQNSIRPWYLSIHFISGSLPVQALLFFTAGIFAILMLFGFYTRFATFMSWYFLTSMHIRNSYVLQNGDILLRLLLFWSIFLPLGAAYSIDSLLRTPKEAAPQRILSVGTAAVLIQPVLMYVFSVILKSGMEWWPDGSAVYYTLSTDEFSTRFGLFLLGFPILLRFLTYAVYFFELIGPFLLFCPYFIGYIRTILVFAFFVLQLGMGMSLTLGNFPWVSSAAMIPFLPALLWEKFSVITKMFESVGKNSNFYLGIAKKIKNLFPRRRFFSKSSKLGNVIAAFFLIYILLWSLDTISIFKMPQNFKVVGYKLVLDHKWNMFGPRPYIDDGWYVIPGKLKDGKVINLFNNGEKVSWDKPKLVSETYKNFHWRKYMRNLWNFRNSKYPFYFSRYLCYDWNKKNEEQKQLQELEIFFVLERTLPDYTPSSHKNISIWKHYCFNEKLSLSYSTKYNETVEGYYI